MSNLSRVFAGSKVLITGHTGFKGGWLAVWLKHLGATVIGCANKIPTNPALFQEVGLDTFVQDFRIDVRNFEKVSGLISEKKPNFIFHLAAQPLVRASYETPQDTWSTNANGTLNVLEAVRKSNNPCVVIFVTSDKCYDNQNWAWGYKETDRLGGPDPYSASKAAAELAISSYVRSYFPTSGLVRVGVGRAGNVIGGGDWASDRLVPDCVRSWSENKVVELRNPNSTRPWQHVLEPLSGYLALAMELHKSPNLQGEAFNFGPPTDQTLSTLDLVSMMAKHWGDVSWRVLADERKDAEEALLLKLNCDKSMHCLGWKATFDIEKTIGSTVSWYKNFYEVENLNCLNISLNQISSFINLAKSRGLPWAQ